MYYESLANFPVDPKFPMMGEMVSGKLHFSTLVVGFHHDGRIGH